MALHYRDNNGNYLGAFDVAPEGGIQCTAPENATSIWTGTEWSAPQVVSNTVTKEQLQSHFEKNTPNWPFVKRVRDTEPEYIDQWVANDQLDKNNKFVKALARGLNTTAQEIINSAAVVSLDYVEPTESELVVEEKERLKALITAERDRRKFQDIAYAGDTFNVSEWDILMISSLLQTSNSGKALPTDDYWRTATNTQVNLTNTDLNNLDDLIRAQIQNAYTWSWTKKGEIDACTTLAQLQLIDLQLTTTS